MIVLLHFQVINLDVDFIKQVISYLIVITAVGILLQDKLNLIGKHLKINSVSTFKFWQPWLTVTAGITLNTCVTLTYIGAGAIGVVMLLYLYPLRLSPTCLIAIDIVHAIPLAMFASTVYLLVRDVALNY